MMWLRISFWFCWFLVASFLLIPPETFSESLKTEWGGHVRGRGSVSYPSDDSVYQLAGTGAYYDGTGEFRLKNKILLGTWGYVETHYESIFSGGDTRKKQARLAKIFPEFAHLNDPVTDDFRFMYLTSTIEEDEDYIFYHRLDRLSLTLMPEWGSICIGRQALTWGNGMVFNPMDLFNPFSPTDIERDYKIGDDMISTQFSVPDVGDFQFLLVPRRDRDTHDIDGDSSSIAGKFHFATGTTEFDIMAARHYKDYVAGIGSMGYMGNAAWRLDATWTILDDDSYDNSHKDGFLTLAANMDYSWVWWEKNFYGLVEFYYNGLGDDNYAAAYASPEISERLDRGEIYTLGKTYLAGEIQIELHPLLNFYLTAINNMTDPSGVFQPRAIWDVEQNVQCILGANLYYGGTDTEFGGFRLSERDFLNTPSDSVFLWLTWFF